MVITVAHVLPPQLTKMYKIGPVTHIVFTDEKY